MRTLLIYSSVLEEEYETAYVQLANALFEHGVRTCFAMPPYVYRGVGVFSGGFDIRNDWKEIDTDLQADIVFNKSLVQFRDEGAHIVNHPVFDRACDKDETIDLFPEHCPRSVYVETEQELAPALEQMRTDTIVIKPAALFGGQGVWIGKKSSVGPIVPSVIVQEFIDTQNGIPGVCDGRHDLRLIYFGNRLVDAYVRQPGEGKMVANVALGGSIKQVKLQQIPHDALDFATSIDAAFRNFPDRVYSIDLGLDRGRDWRLIELNSPPGLPLEEDEIGNHIAMLAEHLATSQRTKDPTIIRPL